MKQIFLIHAHISYQPIKTRVWQHITKLNTAIDQWDRAYYPNYFL